MSDPALTNGGEADETDLEAAPEFVDDEADQTHAIVDEDEAILEAALDRKSRLRELCFDLFSKSNGADERSKKDSYVFQANFIKENNTFPIFKN